MLQVAFAPIYKYELPEGHRFPMLKYELLQEQLVYEGTLTESHFFHPAMMTEETLLLTHTAEYWEKLLAQNLSAKEIRAIGFPMSPRLVERGRYIAQGTIDCALFARQFGVAMNIAGGTHHAYADHGEGFCIFNDIAVATNYLLHHQLAKRILVIDLDVHQGNGTAHIFRQESRVFTFSMHGEKNYPTRKEKSDLDIGLADKTADTLYLDTLYRNLPLLFDTFQPDQVFYLSGVDILETDKLGRLSVSLEGCRERDRFVLQTCRSYGVPVTISMGGGYSPRIATIVEAHANTFRLAQDLFF